MSVKIELTDDSDTVQRYVGDTQYSLFQVIHVLEQYRPDNLKDEIKYALAIETLRNIAMELDEL